MDVKTPYSLGNALDSSTGSSSGQEGIGDDGNKKPGMIKDENGRGKKKNAIMEK